MFNVENGPKSARYTAQNCPDCNNTALLNRQGKLECLVCDDDMPNPNEAWEETSYPFEAAALTFSPIFYGSGVTFGNNQPVMLMPGLVAGDSEMYVMANWLRRIGYQAFSTGFVFNVTCPNQTIEAIARELKIIQAQCGGQKIVLIGHSKGGVMARALATRYPELVRSIITLAAPFGGLHNINPSTRGVIKFLNRLQYWQYPLKGSMELCYTDQCPCGFGASLLAPMPDEIDFTAIGSRNDKIVRWTKCFDLNRAYNVEVDGTHFGMVYNPDVYAVIADALAHAPARHARGQWHGLYDFKGRSLIA